MNIFERVSNFFRKDSQGRVALAFNSLGQPVQTPRHYAGFTKEGYEKNVVVYRCIKQIAMACAGIEWELFSKRKGMEAVEIEDHPLLNLIKKPNPLQARSQYIEAVISYYLLSGNSYLEANRPTENKPPVELWTLQPDKISIIPNASGYVSKYVFTAGSIKKEFPVDIISMQGNVYHIKSFNPNDIWYGLSPLNSAMLALDQNNAIQKGNLALIQNNSTPSGVLSIKETKSNINGNLSDSQFKRLQEQIDDQFTPSRNNKPIVLEGGLEYKAIAWSPKEMDFLNNKKVTAEDICMVFGVPPELIGLGAKTYNNMAEANKAFYTGTVLPTMDLLATDLNSWLVPMFDKTGSLYLCYDKDDIEALNYERSAKLTSLEGLTYLQLNEKRKAAGYESIDGWDVFVIGGQIYSQPDSTDGATDEENTDQQENISPGQEDTIQEEDQSAQNAQGKAWKTFNLLNQQEKKSTLRKINTQRKRLESAFDRDLFSDFKEMAADIRRALKTSKDISVLKFAAQQAVDENELIIKKTLSRHIKYTVLEFGNNTLDQAKSHFKLKETKSQKQWEHWADEYIKSRTAGAFKQIQGTTKNQVRKMLDEVQKSLIDGLSVDEVAVNITTEFENISKSRATLISRTEVGSASTQSTLEAARSLDVPNMVKEWISSEDDRVRDGDKGGPDHLSMNGVEVAIDDQFTVPPDTTMDGPGDMNAGADQVCNCRCALVFKSKAD